MPKGNSHEGHEIITETQFFIQILKYLISFPFLILMFLAGKKTIKELFWIFHLSGHFFKDAVLTYNLIIANMIIFIIELFILIPFGLMDFLIISPENLHSGNVLSLFSGMFLHAGFIHLFGNMLFLFVFGRVVEKYYGKKQMIIIYFGAGLISGIVTSGVFLQSGIGASGAISGLVSAAILIRPFYLSYIFFGIPLPLFILGFLQIMGDFTGLLYPEADSNVGHLAHLIGYASIMLTFFLLNKERRDEMKKGLGINLLLLILFIMLNVLF